MESKIRAIAVTISDSRTIDDDISGDTLSLCLQEFGFLNVKRVIIRDDADQIESLLRGLAKDSDLIITTGGTGFSPRDNTPEATRRVIERETPGISEELRRRSIQTTPMAMLSRGVSGIRGKCLIVNFPGSPKAVKECFEVLKPVLSHALELIAGKNRH
jgi:molybdenum cofactor synthesis domain-containing protein